MRRALADIKNRLLENKESKRKLRRLLRKNFQPKLRGVIRLYLDDLQRDAKYILIRILVCILDKLLEKDRERLRRLSEVRGEVFQEEDGISHQ